MNDTEQKVQAYLERLSEMEAALKWIAKVSQLAFEEDEKLRSKSARTMRRIAQRANKVIDKFTIE